MLSISDALISLLICDGCESLSLKTDSRTESSVEVVSWPVKAHQSFTTIPAPITSAPRLMVPATSGTCAHIGHVVSRVTCVSVSRVSRGLTCSKELSSSWSVMEVLGDTRPPWLLRAQ